MLVLTRKSNQSIMIGDDVEVSVLSIMGEKVRIGIQAPQEIPVFRKEIYLEIHREDGVLDEGTRAEVTDALGELGRDEGVVLGAQVDLLLEVGADRALGGVLLADQVVLALELLDVANADVELVRDPCVGAALPHPGADLVEVRAQ